MSGKTIVAQARSLIRDGQPVVAARLLGALSTVEPDLATWLAADRLLAKADAMLRQESQAEEAGFDWARRSTKVALLASHTSGQLAACLRVAAAAAGQRLQIWDAPYRQYEQSIIDPASELYEFAPDVVLIVADHRELRLPDLSEDPAADVAAQVQRWTGLWQTLRERTGARVLQTTFTPPQHDGLGSLGVSYPGARRNQTRRINLALADALPPGVHLIDAEHTAAAAGADAWFDSRYWYLAKNQVGLAAVPDLAREIADVLAAVSGLSRKVIAVDLDNTLWGGVIGEAGVGGITLGDGAEGEAFADFQAYLKSLRSRGLVLAVVSKNNDADARMPFEQHSGMVLTLDDFVIFEATWDHKPYVLQRIAQSLDVGLDSIVFVDDNPAEREAVRRMLPEVGVVELPTQPSGYIEAVSRFPGMQSAGLTEEDLRRTQQYQARSQAKSFAASAGSREDYLAGLDMSGHLEPMSEGNRKRIVQLIGKTNQFNMTGRRHGDAELDEVLARGGVVWGLRLSDRFDDHGLVSALAAVPDGDDLRIDTWVMSCRVLQRTAEHAMLARLAQYAREHGYQRLVGHWVPSGRNVPARDVFSDAGFHLNTGGGQDETAEWLLDLSDRNGVKDPGFVPMSVQGQGERADEQ
ncbi:MAG: methoxymalonyl-ACP biosynthesis protein FkbH [Micrococcales bacterium]|nr:MAG: methoxymalonyl-ACP biosynthesis protein FkbH [Micrococcales bacterium]PIE27864.1 MAG: methoxymalonyl-ACP biosynthesis protein FkbH [Micrococcales bacterium]